MANDTTNDMAPKHLEVDDLDALGRGFTGRVIRPSEGVLLEDRHLKLEDVDALARALIEKSEGRLEELRQATVEVERRVRARVASSREQIDRALATARQMVTDQLEEARNESDRMRETARLSGHDEGQRTGFEKGYAEGLEKGLREGRAEGRDSMEKERRARLEESLAADVAGPAKLVTTLVTDLDSRIDELLRSARAELLDLALGIAGKILEREVREQPEIVRETMERALERIADRHRFTLEVNPDDLAIVREFIADLESKLEGTTSIKIVECIDMKRGGCRITSGSSQVDLSIETQLEILGRRFTELREGAS